MTRDEIYDHLAKVYLDKRATVEKKAEPPKAPPVSWLIINVVITGFILASAVWGLTAFLTQRDDLLKDRIIYTLSNSPIRLSYDVGGGLPQVKSLQIALSPVDAQKYRRINLSVRAAGEGNPGVLKIVLTNAREEKAAYYLQGIRSRWQDYSIAFEKMNLTDWRTLKNISFVIEGWNTARPSGTVLIDNISFSN